MEIERKKLAFQAHLAEYTALRQELLEMIKWRDRLVFLSLSISGALISFSFSSSSNAQPDVAPRSLALYLVAPLASAIGGLWFVNAWRIYRLGSYVREVLAVRVNALLSTETDLATPAAAEVLSWEGSAQRLQHKWSRRLIEWLILALSFVVTGVVAQFLIVRDQPGDLWKRIYRIEMPTFFLVNCGMLASCGILLLQHLLKGFTYRAEPRIKPSNL